MGSMGWGRCSSCQRWALNMYIPDGLMQPLCEECLLGSAPNDFHPPQPLLRPTVLQSTSGNPTMLQSTSEHQTLLQSTLGTWDDMESPVRIMMSVGMEVNRVGIWQLSTQLAYGVVTLCCAYWRGTSRSVGAAEHMRRLA